MPAPPSYRKVNPADQPVLYLALTSSTLPLYHLDEYAETMMAQRISMINGVAQVMVFGAQKYAVRVQLDPRRLASRGVGHRRGDQRDPAVATSICRWARSGARHQAYNVQANGQLMDADAYKPMIVAYRNGNPVRLNDLGKVIDSVENDKIAAVLHRPGDVLAVGDPGHPAPARHQHGRGRRRRQETAADVPRPAAGVGDDARSLRPQRVDP